METFEETEIVFGNVSLTSARDDGTLHIRQQVYKSQRLDAKRSRAGVGGKLQYFENLCSIFGNGNGRCDGVSEVSTGF